MEVKGPRAVEEDGLEHGVHIATRPEPSHHHHHMDPLHTQPGGNTYVYVFTQGRVRESIEDVKTVKYNSLAGG